jgi:hypothetical protein
MTRRDRRFATLALIAVVAVGLGLALSGGSQTEPPLAGASRSGATSAPGASSASPAVPASPTATTPTESALPAGPTITWTRLAPTGIVPVPRQGHTWTVDPDTGIAYLFGGLSTTDGAAIGSTLGDLWAYDLAADAWTPVLVTGATPSPRSGHSAAWIDGLGLVVVSGRDQGGRTLDDSWRFDPDTSSWQPLTAEGPPLPSRYDSCAPVDGAGTLWIVDGTGSAQGAYADAWRYDAGGGVWQLVPLAKPPTARSRHVCWFDTDGRLLVFGGQDGGAALGDLWAADVGAAGAKSWRQLPLDGSFAARTAAAVAIHSDRAVIVGGLSTGGDILDDVGVVNSGGDAIVPAAVAGQAFSGRTRAALIDDPAAERMLSFGGLTSGGPSNETWQAVLR